MPENQPRPDVFLNRVEIELLADKAVIALPRFLEPRDVLIEVLLGEPGRAVDALQHLPPLIAAPIRARRMQQLEVLDLPRTGDMRAAAQIDERAVGVDRDRFVGSQVADALKLERIVHESLPGLFPAHFLTHERVIGLRHLGHLLFDRVDVFGRERTADVEVVVKAVLDGRAEADLRFREELTNRRRQDVRRGVAQHVERLRILVGQDRDLCPVGQRALQVAYVAVDANGERGFREARTDRFREVGARRARRQGFLAPIRQDDLDLGRSHV